MNHVQDPQISPEPTARDVKPVGTTPTSAPSKFASQHSNPQTGRSALPHNIDVKLEAVDRIQTQVNLNRASLEGFSRELQRNVNHMDHIRRFVEQLEPYTTVIAEMRDEIIILKQEVAALRSSNTAPRQRSGPNSTGERMDDEALEMLTTNLASVSAKASEVDALKLGHELIKRRMAQLEKHLGSSTNGTPTKIEPPPNAIARSQPNVTQQPLSNIQAPQASPPTMTHPNSESRRQSRSYEPAPPPDHGWHAISKRPFTNGTDQDQSNHHDDSISPSKRARILAPGEQYPRPPYQAPSSRPPYDPTRHHSSYPAQRKDSTDSDTEHNAEYYHLSSTSTHDISPQDPYHPRPPSNHASHHSPTSTSTHATLNHRSVSVSSAVRGGGRPHQYVPAGRSVWGEERAADRSTWVEKRSASISGGAGAVSDWQPSQYGPMPTPSSGPAPPEVPIGPSSRGSSYAQLSPSSMHSPAQAAAQLANMANIAAYGSAAASPSSVSASLPLNGSSPSGSGIGSRDPYAHTKKTRTKPVRNSAGVLIRKDGRPDMRSQSSAANLRKVHAKKDAEKRAVHPVGTPASSSSYQPFPHPSSSPASLSQHLRAHDNPSGREHLPSSSGKPLASEDTAAGSPDGGADLLSAGERVGSDPSARLLLPPPLPRPSGPSRADAGDGNGSTPRRPLFPAAERSHPLSSSMYRPVTAPNATVRGLDAGHGARYDHRLVDGRHEDGMDQRADQRRYQDDDEVDDEHDDHDHDEEEEEEEVDEEVEEHEGLDEDEYDGDDYGRRDRNVMIPAHAPASTPTSAPARRDVEPA